MVSAHAPSLGQVRKAFPLPGTYHFRFLRTVNNMTVWMDAVDDNMALNAYEGTIFLKASRIGDNSLRLPQQQQQQQPRAPSSSAAAPAAGHREQPQQRSSSSSGGSAPSRSNLLQFSGDDNDHHGTAAAPAVAVASFLEVDADDLIGLNSPEPASSSSSSSSSLPKVRLVVCGCLFVCLSTSCLWTVTSYSLHSLRSSRLVDCLVPCLSPCSPRLAAIWTSSASTRCSPRWQRGRCLLWGCRSTGPGQACDPRWA
jgi:hypothetical protein